MRDFLSFGLNPRQVPFFLKAERPAPLSSAGILLMRLFSSTSICYSILETLQLSLATNSGDEPDSQLPSLTNIWVGLRPPSRRLPPSPPDDMEAFF
jgi:hypothetical protein